jgi:hypothetical protein
MYQVGIFFEMTRLALGVLGIRYCTALCTSSYMVIFPLVTEQQYQRAWFVSVGMYVF